MSSSDIAIQVQGLSKCYLLYDRPIDRLKQAVYPRLRKTLSLPERYFHREFWALSDISFTVRRGETFGIVGRNGAGKSTLLQLIAGTATPTQGSVQVFGKVAALLELGSGFNPEFTGRENVFLNAALLGLTRAQTLARFDEIVAFAELGEFIDQPVKTYSSGMVVRLAFAVSVCVEPDILIVDEALAVGDAAFQFKCLQRIEAMQSKGTTLLFVSHDMSMVQSFCRQAMYLEHGRIKNIATPEIVAAQYFFDQREAQRQSVGEAAAFERQTPIGSFDQSAAFGDGQGRILSARFIQTGQNMAQIHCRQPIEVDLAVELPPQAKDHFIAAVVQNVRLLDLAGRRFPLPDNKLDHPAVQHYRLKIDNPFCAGDYFVTLRLMRSIGGGQSMPRQTQIAALHFQSVEPGGGFPFIGLVDVPASLTPQAPQEPQAQTPSFRVVALMTVRNEARYLDRCLAHLIDQGIDVCVIDNDSTDETLAIANRWLGRGVFRIEHLAYPGYFDLQGILQNEQALAQEIDADWFIHHDADEIRQTQSGAERLVDAIQRIDRQGFNAIDFLEFVFVPPNASDANNEHIEQTLDYVTEFEQAYFFAPRPFHRVNAWKKGAVDLDLVTQGGHQAIFADRRIAQEKFILRHYPFLSWSHLVEKYTKDRVYSDQEVRERGWHGARANFDLSAARSPDPSVLITPARDGWDISRPLTQHPFLGASSAP